jgi:DNA-binding transcriptional LysR family regulator
MEQYPDIQIDLVLSNYALDLIAGGIDVAIRAGHFEDSSLIAKQLGKMPLCLVGSPKYLGQHGRPKHPNDLVDHECSLYSPLENPRRWPFVEKGKVVTVSVGGRFQCDDGVIILDMVLAGGGLTLLPYWMVLKQLARGELELLLEDFALPSGDIKMVYPDRKHLPLKTRSFLDFMTEQAEAYPRFDRVS